MLFILSIAAVIAACLAARLFAGFVGWALRHALGLPDPDRSPRRRFGP